MDNRELVEKLVVALEGFSATDTHKVISYPYIIAVLSEFLIEAMDGKSVKEEIELMVEKWRDSACLQK